MFLKQENHIICGNGITGLVGQLLWSGRALATFALENYIQLGSNFGVFTVIGKITLCRKEGSRCFAFLEFSQLEIVRFFFWSHFMP